MVKLHLSPSEDCRRVVLDLIALPVKASAMKNLPSYEIAKSGAGYPALLVKEGSKYPTRLAPAMADEAKPFGLPSWPLLLMGLEETVFPDQKLIVQAIRAMWHNAILPPVVLAEDWWRMNKEAKVSASAAPRSVDHSVRSDWCTGGSRPKAATSWSALHPCVRIACSAADQT